MAQFEKLDEQEVEYLQRFIDELNVNTVGDFLKCEEVVHDGFKAPYNDWIFDSEEDAMEETGCDICDLEDCYSMRYRDDRGFHCVEELDNYEADIARRFMESLVVAVRECEEVRRVDISNIEENADQITQRINTVLMMNTLNKELANKPTNKDKTVLKV